MRRYVYKMLRAPTEDLLNELGAQGWRVIKADKAACWSFNDGPRYPSFACILMERESDPGSDRPNG